MTRTIDPAKFRRVTKSEDETAWKAKRRTSAAPGKFRAGKSRTITQRQYQEATYGGEKIEVHIEKQRPFRTPEREDQLFRANQTRKLRGEMIRNQILPLPPDQILKDREIIKKFKAEGYDGLSSEQKTHFADMFKNYPPDLVRNWLGSSEKSRKQRTDWDNHVKKSYGSKLGPRTSRDYRVA